VAVGLQSGAVGLYLWAGMGGGWSRVGGVGREEAHHGTVTRLAWRPGPTAGLLASCGEDGAVKLFCVGRLHEMKVEGSYLNMIREGRKTVEGRIHEGRFKEVLEGDYLEFFEREEDERVKCRVVRVGVYASFEALLTKEGVENCLPSVSTVTEGVEVYRGFPGYSEKEKTVGVVGFHLNCLK